MNYKMKENTEVRVAISGKSGCGNTTVSSMLAEKLGIKLINYTFRQLAAEKGLTLAEVIENAKTDDSYDITVDTRQVDLARQESCILGSRLAIWMLKEANLKVYLLAAPEVRAKRILNREGGNLQEIIDFTSMRDNEDSRRYMKLYQIDNSNYEFADLIIDTSVNTPEQIVNIILEKLESMDLIQKD
ncbi:MAG: cytidylate kinase family protein [Treponema sp.]|nr:cytidylate kinase family protein [Treponema sp.]MBQ5876956.1 cytidylate kinase family protein [Treponema sp.]